MSIFSISALSILVPCGIVAWALTLMGLERLFPYQRGYAVLRPDFWNDLLLYTFLQSWVLGHVIAAIIRALDDVSGLSGLRLVREWPLAAQLAFFVVLHDVWQYWFHRFQHRNRWLWRIHEAAHAPLHVDWLSGSRSHPIEILIAQTCEYAPIFLLGASPEIPLLKGLVDAMWGMFNHSNVAVRMGPLLYVLNGPELHRFHHDLDAPRGGANLSTKLSVWDWLFGTAYFPGPAKVPRYGLVHSDKFPHGSYWRQLAYAFRRRGHSPH